MTATTRSAESNPISTVLFMALELGSTTWKVACTTSLGQAPRIRDVRAGELTRLWQEIAAAKQRFGLGPEAPVRSCYEAGRDGFWLHRALTAHGVTNVVVDAASITVDRRARRAKTDRVDVRALLTQLMHATAGDRRGWREVHVPSVQAEADRQVQREWETVAADRKRLRNRIQGLLATQGVRVPLTRHFRERLATVHLWDGSPVPAEFLTRLERDWDALRGVEQRLATLRRLRRTRVMTCTDRVAQQARGLANLRAVGLNGALTLSTELFAWRDFANGRQVGACVGLTPTPYQSDQGRREQGISRSGNRRVRALSVQLAWAWVRYQPASALTRWFTERFGAHARARRIGIVALARKLLVALWRYVETGAVPAGAVMKA